MNPPTDAEMDELEARYQAWVASGCGEAPEVEPRWKQIVLSAIAGWGILIAIGWIAYLAWGAV